MDSLKQREIQAPERPANVFYLDIIRICAIYLVVLLHALNPWLSVQSLYGTKTWLLCILISPLDRMGVPLFFMISGYLILSDPRTLDIAAFYKRRLPRILIPFLVWNVVYYMIANRSGSTVPGFLDMLLNQTGKYHFWYVYVLVGMYMLAPFFKKMVDSCTKNQLLWLMILVLFPVTIIPFVRLITRINIFGFTTMIEGYVGFFLFGYLLVKWPPERKARLLMYGLGIAAWLGNALGTWMSSSPEQILLPFNTGYNIVHYMTAGAFFVLVQALSEPLEKKLPARPVKYWASVTYGIYLCHVLVLDVWTGYVHFGSTALNIFSSFVATAVVSTLIMLVLGRIPAARKLLL